MRKKSMPVNHKWSCYLVSTGCMYDFVLNICICCDGWACHWDSHFSALLEWYLAAVVSSSEIAFFRENGAVKLKGLLDDKDVKILRQGIDFNIANPSSRAIVASLPTDPGRFFEDFYMFSEVPQWVALPPGSNWFPHTFVCFPALSGSDHPVSCAYICLSNVGYTTVVLSVQNCKVWS